MGGHGVGAPILDVFDHSPVSGQRDRAHGGQQDRVHGQRYRATDRGAVRALTCFRATRSGTRGTTIGVKEIGPVILNRFEHPTVSEKRYPAGINEMGGDEIGLTGDNEIGPPIVDLSHDNEIWPVGRRGRVH